MTNTTAPNHLWVYEVTATVDLSVADEFAAIVRYHMEVRAPAPSLRREAYFMMLCRLSTRN